jgi:hypothetical protein
MSVLFWKLGISEIIIFSQNYKNYKITLNVESNVSSGGGAEAVVGRANVVAGVVAARLGEGQAQAFDLLLTARQLSFLQKINRCLVIRDIIITNFKP